MMAQGLWGTRQKWLGCEVIDPALHSCLLRTSYGSQSKTYLMWLIALAEFIHAALFGVHVPTSRRAHPSNSVSSTIPKQVSGAGGTL